MAHLPQDQLPSEFDVVVDGTGLVQSIVAAALSRAGKTVLHIDRNTHYGELWASLMHREMVQWMADCQSHDQQTTPPDYSPGEGERVIKISRPHPPCHVTNLVELIHTAPEVAAASDTNEQRSPQSDGVGDGGESGVGEVGEGGGEGVCEGDDATGGEGEGEGEGAPGEGEGGEEVEDGGAETVETPPTESQSPKVTWQSLEPDWRRFNFDLIPKFLYCRGSMVDLVTQSSCSRYLEFRAVGGIFNYNSGRTEQVPCSRSDVFSSKAVSMLEKRKMMKFLTFCSDFQQHPEEYEEFVSLPFAEFLRLKDLTPNLIQYIVHSIAMVTEASTTLEGLRATQVFLNSLGRFGNVPFLFPVFGGGELPQAFCRLCAVYGGVYCLHRYTSSIVMSTADDRVTSIVCSTGQKIKCSAVVLSAAFLTETLDFRDTLSTTKLSRAIFVTDNPIQGTEGKLSLLTLTPGSLGSTQTVTIRVMQLDNRSNSCPKGTFLVHMECPSAATTAQLDLEPAARAFFNIEDLTESNSSGPRLLWSLYFNVALHRIDQSQASTLECPGNVYLTSDPDGSIGYENVTKEAREIFSQLCPGEEFLPHPPDPEDIVYEANNPGTGEGGDSAGAGEGEATADDVAPSNGTSPTNDEAPPTSNETPPTTDETVPASDQP